MPNRQKIFRGVEAAFDCAVIAECSFLRMPWWKEILTVAVAGLLAHNAIYLFRRYVLRESPDVVDVHSIKMSIGSLVRSARSCGDEQLARRIEAAAGERRMKRLEVSYTGAQMRSMLGNKAKNLDMLHQVADSLEAGFEAVEIS